MRPHFVRMNPRAENMAVEWRSNSDGDPTFSVLCAECGWEGEGKAPTGPWVYFMGHRCRLVIESIGSGW